MTRSLGDFSLNPFVSCQPEVFGPIIFSDNDILILACDGLWDVLSDDKAVKIALSCATAQEAAKQLKDRAYNLRSRDNISVLVVFFPGYKPGIYQLSSSTGESETSGSSSNSGDPESSDSDSSESSESSESGSESSSGASSGDEQEG